MNTQTPASTTPTTSGTAVTSLVLGILSIFFFGLCGAGILFAIPAVICGHIAKSRIKGSGGTLTGNGLAVGGLATGYVGMILCIIAIVVCLLFPVFFATALPAVSSARNTAQEAVSLNNARQLAVACLVYAGDHEGELPEDLDVLIEKNIITRNVLESPFAEEAGASGYRMVAKGNINEFPDQAGTVLIEEIPTSLGGNRAVAFLDGHVEKRSGP